MKKPMVVKDLDNKPSYWLVPIASKDRLIGFIRLSLEGELLAYGKFGQGQQLRDFPPLYYLSMETAYKEIRKTFKGNFKEIGDPQLVHDVAVDRFAWLVRGIAPDGTEMFFFWTFGVSYSRPKGNKTEIQTSNV